MSNLDNGRRGTYLRERPCRSGGNVYLDTGGVVEGPGRVCIDPGRLHSRKRSSGSRGLPRDIGRGGARACRDSG